MRRVVKVGGSLLSRSDLRSELINWFAVQPTAENLCIIGGGEVIDAMRRLDEIHKIDSDTVHWLCVDLLSTTFQLAASWFDWPAISSEAEFMERSVKGFSTETPTWVNVSSFYRRSDSKEEADPLPHDWRTTTDSIAACLATRVQAEELVLLKSCAVDSGLTFGQMAELGIVDKAFPAIAGQLECVRLETL